MKKYLLHIIFSIIAYTCIYGAIAQTGSMVLSGSDLKLVTDDNTKLNLWDLNIVNNANADPIVGNAEFVYDGTSAVGMSGTYAMEVQKLTILNPSGLTLSRSINVIGNVNLSAGKLNLNGNTLTLGTATSAGTITGANSSNYIVAYKNGTTIGKLVHRLSGNATYSFPIGDATKYTPVSVTLNSGTLSNATIEVYTNGSAVTGMNPNMAAKINRSWFVEPTGITNPNYNISYSFGVGDHSGDQYQTISPCKLSNGVWYQPSNSLLVDGTAQGTEDATTYASNAPPSQTTGTLYWNGLTSFSEFGGAGGSQPLPVELVSFSGSCDKGIISLTWQTASEHNSSHFDVEKSRDGENWQLLSTLPSAGTSNELITYQSKDQNGLEGNNYFRLRQVDVDGKEKLYDPINVSCSEVSSGYFSSFPNPSGNTFQVIVNNKELIGNCILNVVDASGKVIEQREIEVKDGINMFVINQELTPGIYFLNVSNGSKSTPVIRHAIK